MKIHKNESLIDRLTRILLAEIILLAGYFWLGGFWQIIVIIVGLGILVTGLTGFCSLYTLFGINTRSSQKKLSSWLIILFLIVFITVGVAGSYYSIFFTKKIFLDDYSVMNNSYKQTLFFTGKVNREESIVNYNQLVTNFNIFSKKYSKYHPYSIRTDKQFNIDLERVSVIIEGLKEEVNSGNLAQSHLEFETIRPIFQDILKRNNFSMLAVALVDFHDAMEEVVEAADIGDVLIVELTYVEASLKLEVIEGIINDTEIQLIRTKLDEVLNLAKNGDFDELSDRAAELKSSYVKVYLKRG